MSITKRINHRKKSIYCTPHIFLYLQCFPPEQLEMLRDFIYTTFGFLFHVNKRRDGFGHILRLTTTSDTYSFLHRIGPITKSCPSMYYKTNWEWRFQQEQLILSNQYPGYEIIASSSERSKKYEHWEIETMISAKKDGVTDKTISERLGRTYWSVVYKLAELRKSGRLE